MRWHRYLKYLTVLTLLVFLAVCGGSAKAPEPAGTPAEPAAATPAQSVAASPATPTPVPLPPQILFSGALDPSTGASVTDYGIYAVSPDGPNLHRIDEVGQLDYFPAWSPDGRRIAFTRKLPASAADQASSAVIAVMDADGSNLRLLTDPKGTAMFAAWSPDGTRIALERVPAPGAAGAAADAMLAVVNADGTGRHDIAHVGSLLGLPSWSPDGAQLAYTAGTLDPATQQMAGAITVVGQDGSGLRQIAGPGDVMWPSWSPDGASISYTALSRTSNSLAGLRSISIDTVHPDGTNQRSLTRDQVKLALLPAWSPDGRQMAFTGSQGIGAAGIDNAIYVMNADGSNLRTVVQGAPGLAADVVAAPSWSPNGRQLAYVAVPLSALLGQTSGQSAANLVSIELRVTGIDGAAPHAITGKVGFELTFSPFNTVGSLAPAWRPGTP